LTKTTRAGGRRAWRLFHPAAGSVVAIFQCILLKCFEINGLQAAVEPSTRLYPQNLWATHPYVKAIAGPAQK
jgi:hypothetical protein